MPTPNMSLILPTDHDTADTWGVVLNAALTAIDAHTHAPGSGAKVSISSLAIDADVQFVDSGGGKHAIYDLKAIDFFPVTAADVSGFAGALFLNSADNELYYRTTLGSNVKITAGATLNVGAFTGGFGGDYTGAGALAIFDDASDAYWFQQQVGAAVRQFAKMRSADLSLFEFKAVGTSPVPTQAVTLKSPTALAAGYALTMPGAVAAGVLRSDSGGNLTLGATVTINIPVLQQDRTSGISGVTVGDTVNFGAGAPLSVSGLIWIANPVPVGATITAIRVKAKDVAGAPLLVIFAAKTMAALVAPSWAQQGGSFTSAGSGAIQLMSVTGINYQVPAFTEIGIAIGCAAGCTGAVFYTMELDYTGS